MISRRFISAAVLAALLAAPLALRDADAARYDRWVEVVNGTGVTLTRLYASHVGHTEWGRDHLGHQVLEPGQSISVNLNDGSGYCMFDFRGEFADGEHVENYRVNVCAVSVFRFHD